MGGPGGEPETALCESTLPAFEAADSTVPVSVASGFKSLQARVGTRAIMPHTAPSKRMRVTVGSGSKEAVHS